MSLQLAPESRGTVPPAAAVGGRDADQMHVLAPPFRHDQDLAWAVTLPAALQAGTTAVHLEFALYEDERRLGPSDANHADIRVGGRGAHAFRAKSLFFSTSDGTDPNKNGRRYSIRRQFDLSKNYRSISPAAMASFREFVINTRFTPEVKMPGGMTVSREKYLETPAGQISLDQHLFARVEEDRKNVIPWLNSIFPLSGSRILEIGCGSGASTLALAEQGAHVTGLDLSAQSLSIAKERCRLFSLDNVEFFEANAADLPSAISQKQFDFIIFFASLEHMTYDERLKSLADCWRMLRVGRFLGCLSSPNRLWHTDRHTSQLPFFHWLPDQLAVRYAKFTTHSSLPRVLGDFEATPENQERLIRSGRGVSFHEFELAIRPVQELKVVSSRHSTLLWRVLADGPDDGPIAFIRALMALAPGVHPAWFFPRLDLIIEKT